MPYMDPMGYPFLNVLTVNDNLLAKMLGCKLIRN